MGRGVGLIFLVASLVISGLVFTSQWSGIMGTTKPNGTPKPVSDAYTAAADFYATAAERQLDDYRTQYGTYLGARVTGIDAVTLLRADASSYCLQIDVNGARLYDRGPEGGVVTQSCA